jgi:hypothetical protein
LAIATARVLDLIGQRFDAGNGNADHLPVGHITGAHVRQRIGPVDLDHATIGDAQSTGDKVQGHG